MEKLKELLKYHKVFHTNYQMDNLITTRAGGTMYGQFVQSLRELYKRVRGMREGFFKVELSRIKIEKLKNKAQSTIITPLDKLEVKTKLDRQIARHEEAERAYKDTVREFKRFFAQSIYLYEKLTEKHGELTEKVINKLDTDRWVYDFKCRIAIDVKTTGRIGRNSYEGICNLPRIERDYLLKELNDTHNLINWYENKDAQYVLDNNELSKIQIDNFVTTTKILEYINKEL